MGSSVLQSERAVALHSDDLQLHRATGRHKGSVSRDPGHLPTPLISE